MSYQASLLPVAPQIASAFEHSGCRIYPTTVNKAGQAVQMWAVETSGNRSRRLAGQSSGLGDTLHHSPEAACAHAERQTRQEEASAALAREAAEHTAKAAEAAKARSQEVKGMSLAEIRAADYLKKLIRNSDGTVVTRAEWVAMKLAEGLEPHVTQVDKIKPMSRLAHFRADGRQQADHERRRAQAGTKNEYRIGGYVVSKSEYDYAIRIHLDTASRKDVDLA